MSLFRDKLSCHVALFLFLFLGRGGGGRKGCEGLVSMNFDCKYKYIPRCPDIILIHDEIFTFSYAPL